MQFCGGLLKVLEAAGVDLSAASTQEGKPLRESPSQSGLTCVHFELSSYKDIEARLSNKKRLGINLIDREGPIPESALKALR